MPETSADMVAYCGLFCGACGSFRRGRCAGCLDGGGFSSCKVRICVKDKDYRTCADCDEYLDCKLLNNFIARIFGLVMRSNRIGNLTAIKRDGIEKWAGEASALGRK